MELGPADFAAFFSAIHGYKPFPWQQALVDQLADSDTWPDVLDLPTGSGKTAALDVAVYHLALRAGTPGKASLRIALVVDRRLVVDDAFARATKIARSLCDSLVAGFDGDATLREVAGRLCRMAGENEPPLVAQRLRGGAPLEHDWARTPTQPTILCSTVDQVGSRLLFRGYGVSDRMKPVHAGLLGTNSLILLDEAHLAEPFRQTLNAVRTVGHAQIEYALLSATPGVEADRPFRLGAKDRADATLGGRLEACKPAKLLKPVRGDLISTAEVFVTEARDLAVRMQDQGVSPVIVAVVVNRVALAREIFDRLEGSDNSTDAILMIGPSRSADRDSVADDLAPFRTGSNGRKSAKPLFVVATQCLEVGVDLDLDGLVTQAAALDALRQRFGRLNRGGRSIDAEGVIIARTEDVANRADDPVYGNRIRLTWDALDRIAVEGIVDFGVEVLPERLNAAGFRLDQLASARPNAPVVMPAYLDLWSQTTPRPTADPDVALFLHGPERATTGVSVVWRGDIFKDDLEDENRADSLKDIVRLTPPRSAESLELPLWIVQAWLRGEGGEQSNMSDAPEREHANANATPSPKEVRQAFRWAGQDSPSSEVIGPDKLRAGDLLVVPAEFGGCDTFGWAPASESRVLDVADRAAKPYWQRRCAVRIARDVVRTDSQWDKVKALLDSKDISRTDLVEHLLAALPSGLTEDVRGDEARPRDVRGALEAIGRAEGRIEIYFPYADGGAILVAEQGVGEGNPPHGLVLHCGKSFNSNQYDGIPVTEDDTESHTSRGPVYLEDHGKHVARYAKGFAEILGYGDVAHDLVLAAWLHDAGKADPRFQAMLAGGDPWNRPDGPPLAKGVRPWSPTAWERAKLPMGWRHEALSVRMAREHADLTTAHDPALVLWLIGSHHGLGRPFFDFHDSIPEKPLSCFGVSDWWLSPDASGPQSLAFDFDGFDWPALFVTLKRRYGIWGLAHLETVLRLADHRASEAERSL